jgi:hypothetical protein
MIDNPENGHKPDMRDKDAETARDFQTATAVAEPDAETTQLSPSSPGMSSQTVDPMTEAPPTAQAAVNQSEAIAEPTEPATEAMNEPEFSSELTKFRETFEEIQAEFIGEPRAAVEKAETLIDGLMNALHNQLQRIHSNVKTETDTEQLRVAMLSYRELFGSLGGRRAS